MPALKIYRPETEPTEDRRTQAAPPRAGHSPHQIAPAAAWTLRDFAAQYFTPAVLTAADARPETRRAYRDALAYWQRLTGNPPLAEIDAWTVAQFADRLRTAAPLRRPAVPGGSARHLAPVTQHRILRTLRALLRAAGPLSAANRPAAGYLPALFVPLPKLRPQPAPAPAYQALRLAFGLATPHLRALLATLFYTGLRPGAVLALTATDADLAAGHWTVSAATNSKTRKPYAAPMHPANRRALLELHPGSLPAGPARLLPWAHSPATLRHRWADLLARAGLAPFRLRDIRRTHAEQIAAAGIQAAQQAAQAALQHADGRTTAGHYLNFLALLVSLPDLYA